MCFGSTPDIPEQKPLQPAKEPDSMAARRKAKQAGGLAPAGSILTGPNGAPITQANKGTNTVLGA